MSAHEASSSVISHAVAFLAVALLARRLAAEVQAGREELQELGELHRRIVENVSSGLLTVARSGTVTSFNQEAERITGFAADEVLGRPLAELFPSLGEVDAGDRQRRIQVQFRDRAGRDPTPGNVALLAAERGGRGGGRDRDLPGPDPAGRDGGAAPPQRAPGRGRPARRRSGARAPQSARLAVGRGRAARRGPAEDRSPLDHALADRPARDGAAEPARQRLPDLRAPGPRAQRAGPAARAARGARRAGRARRLARRRGAGRRARRACARAATPTSSARCSGIWCATPQRASRATGPCT